MSVFETMPEGELLALCAWSECRGEPRDGKIAVIHTILERAKHPSWWGHDVRSVILKPWQFSCFNQGDPNRKQMEWIARADPAERPESYTSMLEFARGCMSGELWCPLYPVPTHYYNPKVCRPKWDWSKMDRIGTIGNHVFYREG